MFISDFDSSAEDQISKSEEGASIKWRRSGIDRRLTSDQAYFEEKRGLVGRRINWFELIANFVFPRHSKIK